jgi:hypothetical protein
MGLSSSPEQTRILSQFSLDPSLRINNGLSSLNRRGDVNGEQGVPNNGGIFHPSSGEYRFEGESRGAKAEEDIPDYIGGVQYRSIQEEVEGPEAVIRAGKSFCSLESRGGCGGWPDQIFEFYYLVLWRK